MAATQVPIDLVNTRAAMGGVSGGVSTFLGSCTNAGIQLQFIALKGGGRFVQVTCDQNWGWNEGVAGATDTYANSYQVPAGVPYTFWIPDNPNGLSLWFIAQSTTGNLRGAIIYGLAQGINPA